jgi:hypothetical protein
MSSRFLLSSLLILFTLILSACGGGDSNSSATTYSISGTLAGLTGGSVILNNNGGDALTINAGASSFTFATALASGATYAVAVSTQPSGLTCSVTNGSGTVAGANVINVVVACAPPWTGIKQMGVARALTSGNSVATDASGNVYVAGDTDGGLGGNTLSGTYDFYVTKYNSSGVLQYTKQMGVAGAQAFGTSVATDASGNVYVAGYTNGGLGGNTLTGLTDFFVTKYNSSGVLQYTKQMGAAGSEALGYSVATDASGNVYVAGVTTGGLGGNTLTGTNDFFVTKYNSSGVLQ